MGELLVSNPLSKLIYVAYGRFIRPTQILRENALIIDR